MITNLLKISRAKKIFNFKLHFAIIILNLEDFRLNFLFKTQRTPMYHSDSASESELDFNNNDTSDNCYDNSVSTNCT